jgi:filamentous hemagglutinin
MVEGHIGPHPPEYHQTVYDSLFQATKGKTGQAYRDALFNELAVLKNEVRSPGTHLNNLVTRRGL